MLMKVHAVRQTRFGMPLRFCVIGLATLLIMCVLSACGGSPPPTCTGGLELYKNNCVTHTTVSYLGCIDGKGKDLTQGIELGATLPAAANSTFKVAYDRSEQEQSGAALQIVKGCLQLAEEGASGQEAAAAREYVRKTDKYIGVIQQKSPALELEPSKELDCGQAHVGASPVSCEVTITSTGVAALSITGVETTGANHADFKPGSECVGKRLEPNGKCTMRVEFQPAAEGQRNATLVIHQNLPAPDRGTPLQMQGFGQGGQTSPTLTVAVDTSAAGGTVASNPAGINCPDKCTATFGSGADVTLTLVYEQGAGHVRWDGCEPADSDSCHVQLTSDQTVTAHLSS